LRGKKKEKEDSIDLQCNSEEFSFLKVGRGKVKTQRWSLRKKEISKIELFIDEKNKGQVVWVEISDFENSITLQVSQGQIGTVYVTHRYEYETFKQRLRIFCRTNQLVFGEKKKGMDFRHMGAMMLAYMNGRCNFNFYESEIERPEHCEEITREVLLKMLKRENEIRLSKEVLEIFEKEACAYENNEDSEKQVFIPLSIVQCQENVVKEFNYKSNDEITYALHMLRSARALFPNDLEIQNAAFYLKYNRACRGELQVGDVYKDVPLATCSQEERNLSDLLNTKKKMTVIISGSVT